MLRRILNFIAIASVVGAIGWFGMGVPDRLSRFLHQSSVAPKLSVVDKELASEVFEAVSSSSYEDKASVRPVDLWRSVDALGAHKPVAENLSSGRFDVAFAELAELSETQTHEFGIEWRMLGALASEVRPDVAIRAFEKSLAAGESNPWDRIYLSSLLLYENEDVERAKLLIAEGRSLSKDAGTIAAAIQAQGDIASWESNYNSALDYYLEALEAARVALKSNPASPELLNFVELLHHKAAEAAQNDFQVELAERHLLESISLARDLLRLRPEHYGSLMNISVAQLRLGGLSNSKGDVSSAKNYFLQALETQQALVSKHPDDTLLKLNLLDTYRALNSLTGDRNYLRDARPIAQMLLSEGQLTPEQVQLATGMLERSEPE